MIIAKVTHGLGNQLFQYAAARSLATRLQTALKLDLSYFRQKGARRYCLGDFNIEAEIATWFDIARLCPREAARRLIRLAKWRSSPSIIRSWLQECGVIAPFYSRFDNVRPDEPLPPLRMHGVASERCYQFDPELLRCPDNVCVAGFWQSEKYFLPITDEIRKEFTFRKPLEEPSLEFARSIRDSSSVSIHVRRSDKANNPDHFATSLAYCQEAIRFFRARLTNPRFFFFTDDWEWVRSHITQGASIVFVERAGPGFEVDDLHLMSLCRHNVVSASTFSWWAAWLNRAPEKIVLRPPENQWLRDSRYLTKDVFPPDWISLDARQAEATDLSIPACPANYFA